MSQPLQVGEIGSTQIVLYQGDITTISVKAIANAANSSLLGGGGVDGAIHAAAGEPLKRECKQLHDKGGCPQGEARITTGGYLPAKYVIHTVGPIWRGGTAKEAEVLARCYKNSIALANEKGITELIFPSISTGIFGYPLEQAAEVGKQAFEEALSTNTSLKKVGWCLFDETTFSAYQAAWQQ